MHLRRKLRRHKRGERTFFDRLNRFLLPHLLDLAVKQNSKELRDACRSTNLEMNRPEVGLHGQLKPKKAAALTLRVDHAEDIGNDLG